MDNDDTTRQQRQMTTTKQTTTTMMDDVKIMGWATTDNNTWVLHHPTPLVHSSVVLVYLVNQIHIFPMLVATRLVPQPVLNQLRLRLVETGLSTVKN